MAVPSNGKHMNTIEKHEDEIDLFNVLMTLWKWKKFIIGITLLSACVAIIVTFTMTSWYLATTTIIPLSSNNPTRNFNNSFLSPLTMSSIEEDTQKILAVLYSRTIRENVATRLDLLNRLSIKVSKSKNKLLAAAGILPPMVNVSNNKSTGIITITAESYNAELARDIANAYVTELQDILNSKAFSVTRMKREFIEEQIKNVETKLKKNQKTMVKFQKDTKIIQPADQFKGTIAILTDLLSKKTGLEIEIKTLEMGLAPDSPLLKSSKSQLAIINNKIRQIEGENDRSTVFSMHNTPEGLLKYSELNQELDITKTLYDTLLKLYEQSKIEEAQQSLYVQVIDPAITPETRSRPQKKRILYITSALSFGSSIFLVFFLEWLIKARKEYNMKKNKENFLTS